MSLFKKKRMNLLIFGAEASGKSTFLMALWSRSSDACKNKMPDAVNSYFANNFQMLEKGNAVVSTPKGRRKEFEKIVFELEKEDIEVCSMDCAGENFKDWLETEKKLADGKSVKRSDHEQAVNENIHICDVMLLLIDAHTLCGEKDVAAWMERELYTKLFELARDIFGKGKKGLPIFIACSRADLVDPKLLQEKMERLREHCHALKIHRVTVGKLSLFDGHKNTEPIAPLERIPTDDYLIPKTNLDAQQATKLIEKIWKKHHRTITKKPFWKSLMVGTLLLVVVIGSTQIMQKPKEPTTKEIVEMVQQAPTIDDAKKVYYENIEKVSDSDALVAAYSKKIETAVEKSLPSLSFNLKTESWVAGGCDITLCENELAKLGEKGWIQKIHIRKKNLLYNRYHKNLKDFTLEQQAALAWEFDQIGEPIPADLKQSFEKHVRENLIKSLASELQSQLDYKKLYGRIIPELVNNSMRNKKQKKITEGKLGQELIDLREFSKLVSRTTTISIKADSAEKKGGWGAWYSFTIESIVVESVNGSTTIYERRLKPHDSDTKKVHINSKIRKLPWTAGEYVRVKYVADQAGPVNSTIIVDSNDIRDARNNIPGLTYLTLRDCSGWREGHGYVSYRLNLSFVGESKKLLDIPVLLREANKKRR